MDIRQVVGQPGRRGVAVAVAVLTLGLAAGVAAVERRTAAVPTMLVAALVSLLLAATVLLALGSRGRARQLARRVGDRRAAETARADRAEEAARELTDFASAAARNLLAPLHAITGLTELLLEESALDPASRGFLDRIGRNTRRMLGTVDEMASAAGLDDAAVNLEPVDAEHLTLDIAASLSPIDGERPRIDVGDLPMVTADPVLLRQVLDHLIGNAARFVRNGTIARITVGAQELPGGWWRIEVADRGIGVPAEQRTRIFAPFHRTPAAEGYPGAGLGLAVCRRIVALHGGEIGVRANPGGGSVFWFTVSATGVTLSAAELQQLTAA